jgi:hypothetical protein
MLRRSRLSRGPSLPWITGAIPGAGGQWGLIAAHICVALVAIGAGVFGALRPGALRIPFIAAGAVTLILWFLGPVLQVAVLAGM